MLCGVVFLVRCVVVLCCVGVVKGWFGVVLGCVVVVVLCCVVLPRYLLLFVFALVLRCDVSC